MPSTILQELSKILSGITFLKFLGNCGIKHWKFNCMPAWHSAASCWGCWGKEASSLLWAQRRPARLKVKRYSWVSGFSLLLFRPRRRKTYLTAELRSCKRSWLGLGPESEQERAHVEIRMRNAAIGIRDDREIGGVWIWVGVGDRKKRGRMWNLRVMCRRETETNK